MIHRDQTNSHTASVAGLLLLVIAVSVLPLAAKVRADDQPHQENAATQLDIEKVERLLERVNAIIDAHRWQLISRRRVEVAESLNESMKGRAELEAARRTLRTLGFDDQLIETLINDRAKAKSASELLQSILSLTDEDHAKTKKDDAGKSQLRMPKHAIATAEWGKLLQYLPGADDAKTDKDSAVRNLRR